MRWPTAAPPNYPDPIVPSDRALRRAVHEHLAPDLRPHLHVGVHPSPVFSLDSQAKPVGGFEQARGWSGAPLFDQRVLGLRCSPFRSAFTPEFTTSRIVEVARSAIENDRAEVICLGCGGMA